MNKRRQLDNSQKEVILKKHNRRCFIDGEPISIEDTIEFHHIKPYSKGGGTNLDNIAPVCRKHHRSIGTMSLQEYRDKIQLDRFFSDGEPKYLNDVIVKKKGRCGEKLTYESNNNIMKLYIKDSPREFPLYNCPITSWQYFYANIPVEFLENDNELQPRALRPASLWNLYRHFQSNTQLAPSICRIDNDGILRLFDGQHKAASQIWSGRPEIECKVYLVPEPTILKETNLEAHGKFRQMSFYSHELMKKYADIFGEDWNLYMETEGEKSEAGFFNFLVNIKTKTKAQARAEISLAMYNEIIDDHNNRLSRYIPEKNRSRKQPLTFARLKKTFLQHMIVTPPVEDEFESETDFRRDEKKNLIKFMNMIVDECLEGKWNPERNDSMHRRTQRIFGAGSIRAWTILLKDTFNIHLKHYTDEQRQRFFYRRISDEDFEYFQQFIKRLFSNKIWDDPDPSGEIAARLAKDDSTTAKSLFEEKGLTVHWLLGSQN